MKATAEPQNDAVALRARELFQEHLDDVHDKTNRVFFWLFIGQWIFAVAIALLWSPYTWEGKIRSTNLHVPAAIILGGVISSLPLFLLWARPRENYTRQVVAAGQMLWSALLIHLTGGRIETHFHVFGSLAFIAFYRDWKLLPLATVVVAAEHLTRGLLWPESVYGVANPEWWRFLEHALWVVFEDVVLVMACFRAIEEMQQIAGGRAEVEAKQGALVRSEKLAAIGELAASVGHELRNPLAAVKGAMAYLSRRLATARPGEPIERDPKVKEFLDLVSRELGVCNRIISELLDFARDSPPQYEPCPLHSLVSEALCLVPVRAGVSLVNSIPESLPVPSLDKEQFRRVIINLAQNASEAMGERGGRVEVTAAGGGDSDLVIEVRDDGPGIPPDVLPHVFQPLFTTKTKGTGLGLAIVVNMIERHRGSITATSDVGKGSRFVITLPAREVRQAA